MGCSGHAQAGQDIVHRSKIVRGKTARVGMDTPIGRECKTADLDIPDFMPHSVGRESQMRRGVARSLGLQIVDDESEFHPVAPSTRARRFFPEGKPANRSAALGSFR
jgi:hypothetical protein